MSFVQHGPGCNVTALTYIAGLICTTLIFINRKYLVILHSFVRFKNRLKKRNKHASFPLPQHDVQIVAVLLKKRIAKRNKVHSDKLQQLVIVTTIL